MPDPTIVRQIETLLTSGKLGNNQGTIETYRVYLMELADMAEAGDFEAAAELDRDYGIQVGKIVWEGAGAFPAAVSTTPTLGRLGGHEEFLPPGSVPSPSAPPDWAPPGTKVYTDPATGRSFLWGIKSYDPITREPIMGVIATIPTPAKAGGPVEPAVYFDVLTGQRILYNPKTGAKIETLVAPKPSAPVAPTAPVAPYYGAPTEREKAQTEDEARKAALAEAKYRLDVAEFQAKQPKLPLRATTNPDNPDEDNQRREWMRARVANGENPYDYGAFAQHMAAIGAPAAPSYEGFFEVANYEKSYQAKQDALAEAERGYKQRLTEIAAGQALTQYQAGQLGIQAGTLALGERAQTRQEFETMLEAARTGQPLKTLHLFRGTIPGAGGGEIYQGLRPVVPSLATGLVGAGGGDTTYTPEQMARVRRGLQLAGWPQVGTASDTEAVQAYLGTAVPDEFSRQLQAASSGAPAMPPAMATISRGEYLPSSSWPTGALRLPGVQAQANETPTERLARYEALAYQGIPGRDVEDFERRIRQSVGPGLSAGAYQPSPLRLR